MESGEFFLRIGVISADWKARGTYPSETDLLNSFVMNGVNSSARCFTNHVGIWSSPHDLFRDFLISFCKSS